MRLLSDAKVASRCASCGEAASRRRGDAEDKECFLLGEDPKGDVSEYVSSVSGSEMVKSASPFSVFSVGS